MDARSVSGDVADRYYSASVLDAPWLQDALASYEALRATRFNDGLGPWERRDYESDPGLFARTVVAAGDGDVLPEGVRATVRDALIRCATELGVDATVPEPQTWPPVSVRFTSPMLAALMPPADGRRLRR